MRNKLISGFVGAAFSFAASGLALAADMAVKAPPPAPAPTPVANWTGFYVGGNLGGVLESDNGTVLFTDTSAGAAPALTPQSFHDTRFLGGAQAGFNYQVNWWLVGIEGDWDWTDTSYNFCQVTLGGTCFPNGHVSGFGQDTISGKTKWLATLRGRLGVTVGNWLLYGTGGAAWGRIDTTMSQDCTQAGCGLSSVLTSAALSASTTQSGWVAGLGGEWMFAPNWTARVEWLHIDLGTINTSIATPGGPTVQTATWSRSERFDEFRVGVNYLFRPW